MKQKSQKVLFVGMTPNSGGMESYMINIFSKLQNKGFDFYFVNSFKAPIAYSSYIKSKGGHIYNIYIRKHGILRYLTRYIIAKHFFKIHHNFDIIHINALSVNQVYWVKAAKKYGLKHIIFQSHNSGMPHYSKIISTFGRLMSIYNKFYLKHHKICKLAASYNCGKWMFGQQSSFIIINNGINTNYFKPNYLLRTKLKTKLNLTTDKVIITTARLAQQKNYPKIINVFKYVNDADSHVKLVIIGAGGEFKHLEQMVTSLNLNNYVRFLGMQSKRNISKLLNVGDLMLMPSLYEAVPFSLTEAQSMGIFAIVSKNRIPKSANITGDVKYMSLTESDRAWAKVALHILNKPFSFDARLKMNKKVTNSKYNVNNSIHKVINIYRNLV